MFLKSDQLLRNYRFYDWLASKPTVPKPVDDFFDTPEYLKLNLRLKWLESSRRQYRRDSLLLR